MAARADLAGVRAKLRRGDQHRQAFDDLFGEFLDEIDALQPYHWEEPDLHPLAVLDHVNNLSKHRFMPAAVLTLDRFEYLITVDVPPGEQLETEDHVELPIEDGAELARFRTGSRKQLNVRMSENPSFRVSFRDGLDHPWYAVELVEWVSEAVARLEPAFRGE